MEVGFDPSLAGVGGDQSLGFSGFQALVSDLLPWCSAVCVAGVLWVFIDCSKAANCRGEGGKWSTLTRYLSTVYFILVILLSHLSAHFNLECVVMVHVIAVHNEAHNDR